MRYFDPDGKTMVMERVSAAVEASDIAFALRQHFRLRMGNVDGQVGCWCSIEGGGGQGVEADDADGVHRRGSEGQPAARGLR